MILLGGGGLNGGDPGLCLFQRATAGSQKGDRPVLSTPAHALLLLPLTFSPSLPPLPPQATLRAHPHIALVDSPLEGDPRTEEPAVPTTAGERVPVWGNLTAALERLDDEWGGSLKVLDPHANEYMARLKEETTILALAQEVGGRGAGAGGFGVLGLGG